MALNSHGRTVRVIYIIFTSICFKTIMTNLWNWYGHNGAIYSTLDKFEGKRNQEITKSALQHSVTSMYMQVVWTGKKQKLKLEFLILAIHAIVSFEILKCCCRAMSASWYWIVKGCNKEKQVVVKPPTKMYIPYEKKPYFDCYCVFHVNV